MPFLPMHIPAELHRWVLDGEADPARRHEVVVATGPLAIMAYGLLAIDPAERAGFWITSELGELSAEEAEEAVKRWAEDEESRLH